MMLCKLYQLGGKFFCCYGGVVCGNSNTRILMSFMTLLVLPAVFLGLEYYHSIPFDNNVLMPLTLVFALTSLIGFFSSAFADPGILRKQNISSIEQLNIDESNPLFCGFCRVERPNERTLHCKMCDVCVEEMGKKIYNFILIFEVEPPKKSICFHIQNVYFSYSNVLEYFASFYEKLFCFLSFCQLFLIVS